METPEQSSQIGQYMAWSIALAAVVISPGVSWIIMWFQENAATRRFDAERNRRLADEFRREMASMLSAINELSGQMSWMHENGKAMFANDLHKFRIEIDRISELGADVGRIGQSIYLLIDIESEDGRALLNALSKLFRLAIRPANKNFPDGPLYTDLASSDSISSATSDAGRQAHVIIAKLQEQA